MRNTKSINETGKKSMNPLNEEGRNLLEVKKVLLSYANNPILFNSISSSFSANEATLSKEIGTALLNEKIGLEEFMTFLMKDAQYSNTEVLMKEFENFRSKLSRVLESKGFKHFSTSVSQEKAGILITKKIGINLDHIRREFLLTEREAKKLKKEGFVEQYARLKVHAIVKHMIEKAEKTCKVLTNAKLELSDFYHDETTDYYNVDFQVVIPFSERLLSVTISDINSYGMYLDAVLTLVEKEYHKSFNG